MGDIHILLALNKCCLEGTNKANWPWMFELSMMSVWRPTVRVSLDGRRQECGVLTVYICDRLIIANLMYRHICYKTSLFWRKWRWERKEVRPGVWRVKGRVSHGFHCLHILISSLSAYILSCVQSISWPAWQTNSSGQRMKVADQSESGWSSIYYFELLLQRCEKLKYWRLENPASRDFGAAGVPHPISSPSSPASSPPPVVLTDGCWLL